MTAAAARQLMRATSFTASASSSLRASADPALLSSPRQAERAARVLAQQLFVDRSHERPLTGCLGRLVQICDHRKQHKDAPQQTHRPPNLVPTGENAFYCYSPLLLGFL